LPDCPADYTPCDIRVEACQNRLIGIARCLRGGNVAATTPIALEFVTQEDIRQRALADAAGMEVANPNHFEKALVLFGLTRESSFQPEQSAERLTQASGLYRNSTKRIEIIQHPEALDEAQASAVLVHEVVHALQDAEHDLSSLWQRYSSSVDSYLSIMNLIEGEARMHERRASAAMLGLEIAEVDFSRSFANAREVNEDWLFQQPDLYFASQASMPYSHGSDYLYRIWSREGQAAVRARFGEPPLSTSEWLSPLWAEAQDFAAVTFDEPVVPEGEDAVASSWTTMGAWPLYLLLHVMTDEATARRLALAWRGDQLTAFGLGTGQTAASWLLELSDESVAGRVASLVQASTGLIRVSSAGARLTLTAGTAGIPEWLHE
jgi:hypothetical protein